MKLIVVSSLIRETPEVIAEKQRHFQLYNIAAKAAALAPDINVKGNHNNQPTQYQPTNQQPVYYQSTNQQSAFYQPTNHQLTQNNYNHSPQKWKGPLASTIPAGVGGKLNPVQPTAEVAAARNAFFAAYQAELSGAKPHYAYSANNQSPVYTPVVHHSAAQNIHQVTTADLAAATNDHLLAYEEAIARTLG